MPTPTPCLAHYGTTLAEEAPPAGTSLADLPVTGQVASSLAFADALGMTLLSNNLYDGVGRQWIFGRGDRSDPDYFEKDQFSSFIASTIPALRSPRVGDTVFRLPLRGLTAGREHLDRLLRAPSWAPGGGSDGRLVLGPDDQVYELTESSDDRVDNRVISVWHPPAEIDGAVDAFQRWFGFELVEHEADFHGLGRAAVLRRADPAITIQLVRCAPVAPRWTSGSVRDDIFRQVGYSHFRLGAPSKQAVQAVSETVFADTGDVSYVMFEESYLELVTL